MMNQIPDQVMIVRFLKKTAPFPLFKILGKRLLKTLNKKLVLCLV